MGNHDIQKSKHLLKRLDEEMIFLNGLVTQMNNLTNQVLYVSSNIKHTWSSIDKVHQSCQAPEKRENSKATMR